jgi:hypothetical protein
VRAICTATNSHDRSSGMSLTNGHDRSGGPESRRDDSQSAPAQPEKASAALICNRARIPPRRPCTLVYHRIVRANACGDFLWRLGTSPIHKGALCRVRLSRAQRYLSSPKKQFHNAPPVGFGKVSVDSVKSFIVSTCPEQGF